MATAQEKLAAAKEVLHALILGDSITTSAIDGRSTTYTPARIPQVRKYIQELEMECGDAAKGYRGPVRHFR